MITDSKTVQIVKQEALDPEVIKHIDPAMRPLVKAIGLSKDPIASAWCCSSHNIYAGHLILLCSDAKFAVNLINEFMFILANRAQSRGSLKGISIVNIKKPESLGIEITVPSIRFDFYRFAGLRTLYEIFGVPFTLNDSVLAEDAAIRYIKPNKSAKHKRNKNEL